MMSRLSILFLLSVLVVTSCGRLKNEQSETESVLEWSFPLEEPNEGILLGNGVQGLMVWGDSSKLILTVSRSGFWDHRAEGDHAIGISFRELRWYLYSNDRERLMKAFFSPGTVSQGLSPQQLGGGRVVIDLPEDWEIERGELYFRKGEIRVNLRSEEGRERELKIFQDPLRELIYVELPPELNPVTGSEIRAAYNFNEAGYFAAGISPPVYWRRDFEEGFIQYLPEDLPLAMAWRKKGEYLIISTALGTDAGEKVREELENSDPVESMQSADSWWEAYWNEVPRIKLPDNELQEIVDYGLYKQACSTPPQGLPCSLKGPFLDESQFQHLSNNYHFNSSIEMVYSPALASNRAAHLKPLWKMIWSWMPQMKENGKHFFDNENALLLPHVADDRGGIPSPYWTCIMDQGSLVRLAQLAWQNYSYTQDRPLLDTLAWPLLNGAFEGYWSMLTKIPVWGGDYRYSLYYSVSPEYRDAASDAWGRDASYQLAAMHRVISLLKQAAEIKGEEADPRWEDVAVHLPLFTSVTLARSPERHDTLVERIGIWRDLDLEQSHRYHSHLAGIYPFEVIDPTDSLYLNIVKESIRHWVQEGSGAWSGSSIPWAATLHSRTGNSEAAVGWLHYWFEHYTNCGRSTFFDPVYPGFSIIGSIPLDETGGQRSERMQLDGGFGALSAVMELLVSKRQGTIYVLPNLYKEWKELEFSGIRTEGAFLVSAVVREGKVFEVKVKSLKGGELKLNPGISAPYFINGEKIISPVIHRQMKEGETLTISSVASAS